MPPPPFLAGHEAQQHEPSKPGRRTPEPAQLLPSLPRTLQAAPTRPVAPRGDRLGSPNRSRGPTKPHGRSTSSFSTLGGDGEPNRCIPAPPLKASIVGRLAQPRGAPHSGRRRGRALGTRSEFRGLLGRAPDWAGRGGGSPVGAIMDADPGKGHAAQADAWKARAAAR
jgi:hypothetical protein